MILEVALTVGHRGVFSNQRLENCETRGVLRSGVVAFCRSHYDSVVLVAFAFC